MAALVRLLIASPRLQQVLLANSHSLLLQTLFRAESSRPSTTSCVRDRGASHRPTAARTRSTVVAGFRASLADLSATLEGTAAHFVRCIKPNKKQEPGTSSPASVDTARPLDVCATKVP